MRVNEPLPQGSISVMEIWRSIRVFGVPINIRIGCHDGYGACTRDLCTVIESSAMMCNWFRGARSDGSCTCPMALGVYSNPSYEVTVPRLSDIFSLFASVSNMTRCVRAARPVLFCASMLLTAFARLVVDRHASILTSNLFAFNSPSQCLHRVYTNSAGAGSIRRARRSDAFRRTST